MPKVKRKIVKAPRNRRNGMVDTIRARVDPALKLRAERIFSELGLSSSDAIRLFYKQVTLRNGLPFEVRIPNADTREAIAELDAGVNLTRYPSVDAMVEDLSR